MSTLEALTAAWTARVVTPTQTLDGVLAALRDAAGRTPSHTAYRFVDEDRARRDAEASTKRYAEGAPLGPLDGVLIGVKDEMDVEGMPTRSGTVYAPETPVTHDGTSVARLRAQGAILLGKTVQHELGLGGTGITPHGARTPRNPHDPAHAPGGSSSGSAVSVALGLTPVAVSTDGGGSVRIPASICGVWGLKPTFGRIPITGDGNLEGSVGHVGPIASSLSAVDTFLRVTSGPDGHDPRCAWAPALDLEALDNARTQGPQGLRIGVDAREWRDADPAVARACQDALQSLVREGATLVDVSIPLAHRALAMGFLAMVSEAAEGHREEYDRHRDKMGLDVRLVLALGRHMRAAEVHNARRLRAKLRRQVAEVLSTVDLYATPTTATTAPKVNSGAELTGEVDQGVTNAMTRYTFLGNLTGLPAGTAPVGLDERALPIGLHLMGAAWDEASVMRGMWSLDRSGAAKVARPKVFYDLAPPLP